MQVFHSKLRCGEVDIYWGFYEGDVEIGDDFERTDNGL